MVIRRRSVALSDLQLKLIARALADPRRFEILQQIGEAEGTLACFEIRSSHPVTAATLSHHMKELETAGLVIGMKDGKCAHYRLCRDVLDAYIQTLSKI